MDQPQLGDRVREIVTEREGVVTGDCVYLWGCRQLLVHYRDEDGKSQTEWYDVARLSVVERGVVEAIDYWAGVLRHLWLLDPVRCQSRSPEGMRCVFQPDHDGTHMPRKGRGWSWGGDYGR